MMLRQGTRKRYIAIALAMLVSYQAWGFSCNTSANVVNFGNYNPLINVNSDSSGNVSVTCMPTTGSEQRNGFTVNYTILLSTGNGGSYVPRRLNSGAATLLYNLYTNASRTLVWGNGSAGTQTVNDGYISTSTIARNYTVYGSIPGMQNIAAGIYADTITVTVNY